VKILTLIQGTADWHTHRASHFNASDAPAMLGCSPYKTRQQLLAEMATGYKQDIDASTQRIFDAGHKYEALARPLAESFIEEELYPVVGSEGKLSASFDGLTMDETIIFEHKSLNKELRAIMESGCSGSDLPKHYRVQMEQQLMVSGAEKCLFMASKWNSSDQMEEYYHCWYHPDADLRDEIMQGWTQFAVDLENYQHVEVAAEAVGRAPDALPALRIEVTGMVTASNLEAFRAGADMVLGSINRDLQTDQDFADADKAVKFCKEVEVNVQAVKKNALSQTADIDELFRALDSVAAESCKIRKELEGLIKARKANLRNEIQQEAELAFRAHTDTINARLKLVQLPYIKANFADVMKGLKSFDSMRNKVADELARVKIEASRLSEQIGSNLDFFTRVVQSHERHLFHDLASLALKPQADMEAIIKTRIREESDRIDAVAQAKIDAEKSAEAIANQQAQAVIIAAAEKPSGSPPDIAAMLDIGSPLKETPAVMGMPGIVEVEKIKRPTDEQIVFAIATQFGTDSITAKQWILEMDFSEMRCSA